MIWNEKLTDVQLYATNKTVVTEKQFRINSVTYISDFNFNDQPT